MAELEAVLTGNIKDLERALKRAKKGLKEFGDEADEANKRANNTFKRTGRGAANATPAIQEFGRVIQDAPFGIRGVANNIEQLSSQFINLRNQTGSTRQAFSAFLSGLTGPAGILVAISAITSTMVAMSNSGITLSDVISFLTGGIDQATKAQRELNKAFSEGVGQAKSEIDTLNSLLSVARDLTQDNKTRARAIAEINEEYGEYLPNLTQENINTNAVRQAIDKYNQSLLRQAKIKGAQDLISKEYAKILELESKNALDSASALDFLAAGFLNLGNAGSGSLDVIDRGFKRQQKEISESEKRIESLRNTLRNLLTEDLQLGGIATSTKDEKGKLISPKRIGFDDRSLSEIFKVTDNAFSTLATKFNNAPFRTGFFNAFEKPLQDGVKNIPPRLSKIEQRYADFNSRMGAISVNIAGSISGGFATIGQAIAQGGNFIGAVGDAILQTLGSIITQLGQASIAAGVAAISLKNLFNNPAAAIAAGAALVTIGSALSSARGAVGGIGGGNVGGQGSRSFSGSNFTSFNNSGFGGGRVVFEISGRKLIGVLNNSLSANERLGGNVIIG